MLTLPDETPLSRPYRPPFYLRGGRLQTLLASARFRARGPNPMCSASRERILETTHGVRLLGALARRKEGPPRGLAVLLPGWEGSVDSTYMLRTGRALYARGYDVFRLNYRDHGRSHHLNRGLFYAVLLDEVFEAAAQAAALSEGRPVVLVGFSLGGNFALRIGRRCREQPIAGLRRVVAVSPAINPAESTARVDRDPLIRRYFLKKWRRSLAVKQALFPDLYDFRPALRLKTVTALTEYLLARYSEYPSTAAYFADYTLTGGALSGMPTPATLVTAADDPIVPPGDLRTLALNASSELVIHRWGGHNGFLEGIRLRSRYERGIADLFDRISD
jgi:uncharacterized protein